MKSDTVKSLVQRFLILILIIILLVPLANACAGAAADPELARNISRELLCPCGDCDEVLGDCDCPRANELTAFIEKKLVQGQSKEEIIQYMIVQYGERVLIQ
jgi:cytochrome c-type biogenesis protein CcmH/NrfF